MAASEAAVNAVMEALGCKAGTVICLLHREYLYDRGCPVAVAAADAAVDTDRASIQAQTLREAAKAWQSGECLTVMTPRGVGIPAIDYAQRTLDWLRARADRIEGKP